MELTRANVQDGIITEGCDGDVRPILDSFLTLFGTNKPSLEQIWAAMDFVWDNLGVNYESPNETAIDQFYAHPVWLLNGLFVEQHAESLSHRRQFTAWVAAQKPQRVADFGGGYGTLARMIAAQCPHTDVEIVDPYRRPESVRACEPYDNVRFVDDLTGPYDVIVATDVFEHVPDPLSLVFGILKHLRVGGQMLAANHFAPSIKCHLPVTFHFAETWPIFMRMAGCQFDGKVSYGQTYTKIGERDLDRRVRKWEMISARSHRFARHHRLLTRVRNRVFHTLRVRSA
ncbi:MAG: class I SAM-dependent methyltransferase [Rhodospirillales bacterium]|nr:MAG: class I SAM-dependent methyltransferase [Rhodospirillales bacterium]